MTNVKIENTFFNNFFIKGSYTLSYNKIEKELGFYYKTNGKILVLKVYNDNDKNKFIDTFKNKKVSYKLFKGLGFKG